MQNRRMTLAWLAAAALLVALLPASRASAGPAIAEPFRAYYDQHQGIRILGYPLSELTEVSGYAAQYFEKGRIEDHRGELTSPEWAFMYGRLTVELIERDQQGSVSGAELTYASLARHGGPAYLQAPPAGFVGGTVGVHDGVFVPYDAQLRPAPGYVVAPYFWAYINRGDLFPGGWLHDIGLPIGETFTAPIVKAGERRTIFLQAFERTVLTYDMRNPAGWQVERANIGADALRTQPIGGPIEIPAPDATVTLPLHILAHVGQPGEQIAATLSWKAGAELKGTFTALRDERGRGLVIDSLSWTSATWRMPASGRALLELRGADGGLLAQQFVRVLNVDDPEVQEISLYWVKGQNVWPELRHVPRTVRIGTAALNELLWGPAPGDPAGFTTALPTPQQVLSYPGRQAGWGARVTLRSLSITNGLATADFSPELWAYGGGSLRVMLIHEQIAHTLRQFSTVSDVRITIAGQSQGVLQP